MEIKKLNQISVVLGSKNRKNLLKSTINSIRENGFDGYVEIIVVDGGSTDGTCNWLAKQKDILTIIQPNYKIIDKEGISVLKHSWGTFMNIAFKYASSDWIVMVSDDLILAKGGLQKGYDELTKRQENGEKLGGGAFYFREYPRHSYYRVGMLPGNNIMINHGFFWKPALKDINYIDEKEYNFYCADGDLVMRLNVSGWKTIALENSFANHLVHKPNFNKEKYSRSTIRDINYFNSKYQFSQNTTELKKTLSININSAPFWKYALSNCLLGLLLKVYDLYYKKTSKV